MSTEKVITSETLLMQYYSQSTTIEEARTRLESANQARQDTVKTLYATHGKGPYTLDGKSVVAVNKAGVYFLKASVKGKIRGPNKPKEVKTTEKMLGKGIIGHEEETHLLEDLSARATAHA